MKEFEFEGEWADAIFVEKGGTKHEKPIISIGIKGKSFAAYFCVKFAREYNDFSSMIYVLPLFSKENNTILLHFHNDSSDRNSRTIFRGKNSKAGGSISFNIPSEFEAKEVCGKYLPELININKVDRPPLKCWALDLSKKL